ncbi:unnamed protein product [Gongylonema pulchrum]|uniref:G_PROTEIN_RECEP_F1_2 domain-containing protein n=1 Tax=Gongylonema pulchrum TaxID=637853 RepID=A0A183DDI8_9BILA|nr:unnamed protein product [Gongylonema pulchrum]
MTAFRRRQKLFARLKNREKTTKLFNSITGRSSTGGAASTTNIASSSSGSSKDDTLVYILGGIVAMFFICNIPAALNLLFINETIKLRVDYQIFRAVANLLEITNHASQFYVFCACSTDYRTTFLQKFPCFTLPPQYRRRASGGTVASGSVLNTGVGAFSIRAVRHNSVPASTASSNSNNNRTSLCQPPVRSCTMIPSETNQLLLETTATSITGRNSGSCGDDVKRNTNCHSDLNKRGSGTCSIAKSLRNGGKATSVPSNKNYNEVNSSSGGTKKPSTVNENPIEVSSLDDFL